MASKQNLEKELAEIDSAIQKQKQLESEIGSSVTKTVIASLSARRNEIIRELASLGTDHPADQATKNNQNEQHDELGNRTIVSQIADAEQLWKAIHRISQNYTSKQPVAAPKNSLYLTQVTNRYLSYLVDRYRFLEFKGMGISYQAPLRLALLDLYVPLKVYRNLPKGETWDRDKPHQPDTQNELTTIVDLLKKHNNIILLGDPGSGKTTFLKYLALKLSIGEGEALGLAARIPVLLPLSAYANSLAEKDLSLQNFVASYYQNRGIELALKPMIDEALQRGRVLLLLDGLDEIQDIKLRLLVVQRVCDYISYYRHTDNKLVVTSRIVGYQNVRPAIDDLVECTIDDFNEDEIIEFIDHWTSAVERAAHGDTYVAFQETYRQKKELYSAVQRSNGVRQLASNPLLLTILALMKRADIELPERRVELYQKAIESLLKHWSLARGLGRPLSNDLDVIETIRILAPLALWMHQTNPGEGLVKGEVMLRKLVELYEKRGFPDPEVTARNLLKDTREFAGLLIERGPNEYGFLHLTFQEYLAAAAICMMDQTGFEAISTALIEHIADDTWHEISLLTIGYLGIIQQRDVASGSVVERLLLTEKGEPGEAIVMAGQAVLDSWPGGVPPRSKNKVVKKLLEVNKNDKEIKPVYRVSAGQILGWLGDLRLEVTTIESMNMGYVNPGPFIMGTGDVEHHNNQLSYGYWISRYPITNAQFQMFIQAGGYKNDKYWTDAGIRWKQDLEDINLPVVPRAFKTPNHPIVTVTWFESLAYTRWLTEKLQNEGLLPDNWLVTLPSEAEWEKAARGGLVIPEKPVLMALNSLSFDHNKLNTVSMIDNPYPKRRYPWGDELNTNFVAYVGTGINSTCAVGCFPSGVSPYGVEEMSGNVWEWLRSIWGTDWWTPDFGYPYDPSDGREVIDGEDSFLRVVRGGSFQDSESEKHINISYRTRNNADIRNISHGFRICIVPNKYP